MSEEMQEEFVETTGAIIDADPNWVYDGPSDRLWFLSWDEKTFWDELY